MEIPIDLLDQLATGKVALFLGPGLSYSAGLPGWSDLIACLADKIALPLTYRSDFLKVAQYFENELGRHALVSHVVDQFTPAGKHPTENHRRLLALGARTWLTTNYDRLLEQTLEEGELGYNLIVRDVNLPYSSNDKVTLIKLHGDCQQPDSMVITERDCFTYFRSYPLVKSKLTVLLVEKTIFFIGYGIQDPDFRQVQAEIAVDLRGHGRKAYAVLCNVDSFVLKDLAAQGIVVINLTSSKQDESSLLGSFLDELQRQVDDHKRDMTSPSIVKPTASQQLGFHLNAAVARYEFGIANAVVRQGRPRDPYPGLRPFNLEDVDQYYGRQQAVIDLHRCLLRERLTVVQAKSGAGKTSLLRAGLTPLLIKQGFLPLYVRTYEDPEETIKGTVLSYLDEAKPSEIFRVPLSEFLHQVIRHRSQNKGELVLLLDQFEDFFVRGPEGYRKQKFIEALAYCHNDVSLNLRTVIVIRRDYLADLADLRGQLPTIFHNIFQLDPLTEQEAIDAIRLPVSNLNPPIEYENELLSTVLSDLKRGGMELPHLQIICDRLYRSRAVDQTIIQMELYQNLGGVPGILGGYVSEVLGNLSSDQSTVAKRTLMALVDIGDKRETIDERVLAERISGDPAKLATILDCLITARLVQRNKTDQGVSYELGQDYLVQHIRSWIKREDPSLLFVQELLQPEVESWRRFRTVISPDKLRLLYENRGKILDLSGDAVTCLLASVLMSSTSHIEDWIDAMGGVSVVRQGLIRLATSEEMSVQVRSRAGDELGKMGDVRPGVGISTQIIPDIQLPEIHWCVVPEGDFIIGDGTAQQKAHLTEPFEISKYPVTNCQFDGFVNDHGYTERWRECWSEGGWHWKGDREGPQSSYGNQSLPNHPVVGVTGYEAEAFCNWLGKRLDRMIVLPSEIQWEKAARGEDGRRYPWGDEITPDHANYRETRIDDTTTTTAVGIFPKGASPYGVMDMSGNTWELCRSPSNVPSGSYAQRPEHHVRYVLRGGSFGLGPEFLSCAYTITTSIFKNDAIGFRVVRSWESRSLGQ